jgi:hypothetical protein
MERKLCPAEQWITTRSRTRVYTPVVVCMLLVILFPTYWHQWLCIPFFRGPIIWRTRSTHCGVHYCREPLLHIVLLHVYHWSDKNREYNNIYLYTSAYLYAYGKRYMNSSWMCVQYTSVYIPAPLIEMKQKNSWHYLILHNRDISFLFYFDK